jgi:hypothetical protein
VRRYEVKGPCPELGMVLSRLAAEISPGESAVSTSEGPDGVEVVVRKPTKHEH